MVDASVPGSQTPALQPPSFNVARSLLTGVFLGALLVTANVYMGLKTGWWDSGGISAAIVGYILLRFRTKKPASQEATVISQTTASSAASMPAAIGLLGAIPALSLLGHHVSWWMMILWGITMGVAGILAAIALRNQMIVRDALPFPSGIATAEVISSLHRTGSLAQGRMMLLTTSIGAVITWFRDGYPVWIPAALWPPLRLFGHTAQSLSIGFSSSPLLLGVGLMVGLRNGITLILGSAIAWGLIAPWLVNANIVEHLDYESLVGWLLWPGIALMITSGLVSLAWQWRSVVRALSTLQGIQHQSNLRIAILALLILFPTVMVLAWLIFDVSPLLAAGALVFSMIAAVICARVSGETSIVPIGQFGQLTQIGCAAVVPSSPIANIGAASVVAGSIVQAAQTMEAFKIGQLTQVTMRVQIRAALVGLLAGVSIAPLIYMLVVRAYGLGTEALPAPWALPWKTMAQISGSATSVLPPHALWAAAAAILLAIVLEIFGRTRIKRFVPSGFVLGLAFLVPAHVSITIALGALLCALFQAWKPRTSETDMASAGAGAIAGESIIGVLIAFFILAGIINK